MKFMHIADLHLGKKVHEFSRLEDQKDVLKQMIDLMVLHHVDGVLIAGDVYDRSIPPIEAVELLDWFLMQIASLGLPCFMISGNHDAGQRLALANALLEKQQLHIVGRLTQDMKSVVLEDAYGCVEVHMIPYIKPAHVNAIFDQSLQSYEDAMRFVVDQIDLNPNNRHVLIAHQLVLSAQTPLEYSDSEVISIGGLDQINLSLFDDFDYVALGHLHKAQKVGRETVQYAGSPLKYSFSEVMHQKSVTLVHLKEKGHVDVERLPLSQTNDLRMLKGSLNDIRQHAFNTNDYVHVTLTDDDVLDALAKVRAIYPNTMVLTFEQKTTIEPTDELKQSDDVSLFCAFFEQQTNQPLTSHQQTIIQDLFNELKGASHETN